MSKNIADELNRLGFAALSAKMEEEDDACSPKSESEEDEDEKEEDEDEVKSEHEEPDGDEPAEEEPKKKTRKAKTGKAATSYNDGVLAERLRVAKIMGCKYALHNYEAAWNLAFKSGNLSADVAVNILSTLSSAKAENPLHKAMAHVKMPKIDSEAKAKDAQAELVATVTALGKKLFDNKKEAK